MIPAILHRTIPAATTDEVEAFWAKACDLHPTWEHRTWQDPVNPLDFPLTAHLWDRCSHGAQKAGLIRLEAIYRHGGVYIDSDVECYRPFTPLLGVQVFAGWEDPTTVPDAVFGAEAGHPAVRRLLEAAIAGVEAGQGPRVTGPEVFTALLPGDIDVLLLPPGSLYPYHYNERHRRHEDHAGAQPWAFCAHHWAASWVPPQLRR